MIKNFFSSIVETIKPYFKTIKAILIGVVLIAIIVESCDFINSPSTGMVILGCCGLGIAGTYIVLFITKEVKNEIKKGAVNDETGSKRDDVGGSGSNI